MFQAPDLSTPTASPGGACIREAGGSPGAGSRRVETVLQAAFFASGTSALIYQSIWQRALNTHAGMDLYSVTTVIAAFMLGLGIGNLAGGALADRIGARRSIVAYALAEFLIGVFGWFSLDLIYEGYVWFLPLSSTLGGAFLVDLALLALPTFLMGTTLPLLARGVVRALAESGPRVGRLYGLNTLGAAVGAGLMAQGLIIGTVGYRAVVHGAALANILSGLLVLGMLGHRRWAAGHAGRPETVAQGARRSPMGWIVAYGVTGFLTLALEVSWFRLLNVVLYSTTFTFSRLLMLYLLGLGVGSLVGARWLGRLGDLRRAFLWCQLCTGLFALLGPGLIVAWASLSSGGVAHSALFNLGAPLAVIPIPTFFMGVSFTVIQRLIANDPSALGRRTGALLFANTMGCVLGTLVTGFLLLETLGSAGTLGLLSAALGVFGLAAARGAAGRWRVSALATGGVVVTAGAALAVLPVGQSFWATLHQGGTDRIVTAEDGTGVAVTDEHHRGEFTLYINGEVQCGYPFSDFHTRLGVLPALVHPGPSEVLVVGLGMGSTAWGISLDARVESLVCIEICGGVVERVRGLAQQGVPELRRLLGLPHLELRVEDGRRYLLETARGFDVVITDAVIPWYAYSGNLYSREFYALVWRRLKPGGQFYQWVPTPRIARTVAAVFPYVWVVESPVATGAGRRLLVAGEAPIPFDPAAMAARLRRYLAPGLSPEAASRIDEFIATASAMDPRDKDGPGALDDLNEDLFPRDEIEAASEVERGFLGRLLGPMAGRSRE
ncbi:MAG: fused MFS/spermidine synthase [Planctomycetes bacterium]|nr:fused MFS/spermidine synthase [Planctomycetota bacterium]